jgi:hypothetical protein
MEWNGVVNVYVPLFGLVKIQWSGMEYDGTHSILYHPIFSFFHSIQFGVYAME